MPPKSAPRKTKSGADDKRSSSSHLNAQKARDRLVAYIQKGKANSQDIESEDDDLSDDETVLSDVEQDPMQQSQMLPEEPEEEPEPGVEQEVVEPEPPQQSQLERDMTEMKAMLFSMNKPMQQPMPVSNPIPIQPPAMTYYERQMKASRDTNQLLADAFNNQWN